MNNKEKLFSQSEDINTKKPNKSKLDIWKVLGVDFYQDYILPTNPGSKNKFYTKIFDLLDSESNKSYDLSLGVEARVYTAISYLALHSVGFYELLLLDSQNAKYLTINILGNLYPLLVQIRTLSRINKIMNYKNLKTKLPQKIDIND